MSEEPTLIARAAEGADDAFTALVDRHRDVVLRTARAVLGDEASAEDVTQEVFVRLHSSLPGFRGEAELGTWLYRVTLNLCRDHLRRRRRRPPHLAVESAADAPSMRAESVAEEAVDRERARRAVRDAIEALPPEQRRVVSLRYIDDLPYAEIARITGTPTGTVASRVFRALEELGRVLDPRHLEVLK